MTTHNLTPDFDYLNNTLTWTCETCGRKVRINADGSLTVLERGDLWARHLGGSGGLVIRSVDVDQTPEEFRRFIETLPDVE